MKTQTLHEAMEQVLIEKDRRLPVKKLVEIINGGQLYTRIDERPVPISQIEARAKTYPGDFKVESGEIGLVKDDPEQLRFEKHRLEI